MGPSPTQAAQNWIGCVLFRIKSWPNFAGAASSVTPVQLGEYWIVIWQIPIGCIDASTLLPLVDRYKSHNSISDSCFWRMMQQLIHGGLETFHDD